MNQSTIQRFMHSLFRKQTLKVETHIENRKLGKQNHNKSELHE